MSRTWASEMAKYGVTVNCIATGPIATSAFWENKPPTSSHLRKL